MFLSRIHLLWGVSFSSSIIKRKRVVQPILYPYHHRVATEYSMGNASVKAKQTGDSDSTVVTGMTKDSNGALQISSFDGQHEQEDAAKARKRRSRPQQVANGNAKSSSTTPRRKNNRTLPVQTRDDENPNNATLIKEEQILVNIAMSDLMAYLQVVANNSSHLPLTKRDDPELERSVNDLAPEDYARKSAAFVPADVRVIGGVFTKYGQVWDLPTSDVS